MSSGPIATCSRICIGWMRRAGEVQQWGKDFIGSVSHYEVQGNGVLLTGRVGTEVALYSAAKPADSFHKLNGWDGTYETASLSVSSSRVAFAYSSLEKPTEIYLAESGAKLQAARPITSFNKLFTERDLPKGKPYRWRADDGTMVEGMLMYPPGKFEAKNLPMFVFIHGGPRGCRRQPLRSGLVRVGPPGCGPGLAGV